MRLGLVDEMVKRGQWCKKCMSPKDASIGCKCQQTLLEQFQRRARVLSNEMPSTAKRLFEWALEGNAFQKAVGAPDFTIARPSTWEISQIKFVNDLSFGECTHCGCGGYYMCIAYLGTAWLLVTHCENDMSDMFPEEDLGTRAFYAGSLSALVSQCMTEQQRDAFLTTLSIE